MDIAGTQFVAPLAMGLVLASTAGLRAFLPLLGLGIAVHTGWWQVNHMYEWVGSWPALITFGSAFVLETVADKWPLLDHALHAVGTFVAPAAGTIAMASVAPGTDPVVQTTLGLIAGGIPAGTVHMTRAVARPVVTVGTAGIGNIFVSIAEDALAIFGTLAAFFIPVLAAFFVIVALVVCVFMLRALWRTFRAKKRTPQPDESTAHA